MITVFRDEPKRVILRGWGPPKTRRSCYFTGRLKTCDCNRTGVERFGDRTSS